MDKETKVFGIIYLTIWGLLMLHCAYSYYIHWPIMVKDIGMFLIFPMVVHCVWLIPGLKKTGAKKVQKNSIICLFAIFAITMMFCIFFNQLCKVIIYSRAASDISRLSNIQEQICGTIEELDPEGTMNPELGSSYLSLADGTTITNWSAPDDDFSKELAERLNISRFSELENQFYCTRGKAIVTVKLVDGVPYVTLENAIDKKGPAVIKRVVP